MDFLAAQWNCQIPVQVKLAEDNISSPTSLPPLYFIVPRQSYLSCLAAQAWPFVQHVLSAIPGQPQRQPWFDYEGIPLRGQFPIGLLYDLTTGSTQHTSPPTIHGASSGSTVSGGSGSALPWKLTLHYSPPAHPHEEAMLNTQGAVAAAAAPTLFLNSLKEACFICQGSEGSSAAMRMAGGAQGDAMWNSIERGDLCRYRSALSSLRVKPTARQGAPPSIPMRVFVLPPDSDEGTALWDAVLATSRPIPAQTLDGGWTTLGQVLSALLPSYMPPQYSTQEGSQGQRGQSHQGDTCGQQQQQQQQQHHQDHDHHYQRQQQHQQQQQQQQQQQIQGQGRAEQGSSTAGECQPRMDSIAGREEGEGAHGPAAEGSKGIGRAGGGHKNQGAEAQACDRMSLVKEEQDGACCGHASGEGREAEGAALRGTGEAGEARASSTRQAEGDGSSECGSEGVEGLLKGSGKSACTENAHAEESPILSDQVDPGHQLRSKGEGGEGASRASPGKFQPEWQGSGQLSHQHSQQRCLEKAQQPHQQQEQEQQPHQEQAGDPPSPQLPNQPLASTSHPEQPQEQQQQQQQQQYAHAQEANLCSQQHSAPRVPLQLLPMVRVDADGRRVGGSGRDVGLDFREGRRKLKALVSGIEPPLDAPVAWLHANMHAPDYFLYVVVL